MCGPEALRVDSYDYYCEAIAWREQQEMPAVGISIDRRTFKHASVALQESLTASLICACCMCQFTCIDGNHGEIGRINAQHYFDSISFTSFRHNWCAAEYMDRYGNTPAMENHPDLAPGVWTFKRTLQCSLFAGHIILCCPEDIKCNGAHEGHELHSGWHLPLCRECYFDSTSADVDVCKVARCLANDNVYGLTDAYLLKYRVC